MLFEHGKSLSAIRAKVYPKHKKSERDELNRIICNTLGFEDKSEFKVAAEKRDKLVAEKWKDSEKAKIIKKLFEEGYRLEDIRDNVFPQMKFVRKGVADQIILKVLECENWGDYESSRRKIYAKNRGKLQSEAGWLKARKTALERDKYKCTVTGSEDELEVHHIDWDFTNSSLNNLITLCKEVHLAVTNGANGMTEDEIKYWENYKPSYTAFIRKRIKLLKKYIQVLNEMEYKNARVERHATKGGHYWFAVHEKSSLHIEPGSSPLDIGGKYNEDPFHELISKLEKENN